MLFMIMKSDINKLVCIRFVHLSSTSLEYFKDRTLIIPEILELMKLHTYKFGLVYIHPPQTVFVVGYTVSSCLSVCTSVHPSVMFFFF